MSTLRVLKFFSLLIHSKDNYWTYVLLPDRSCFYFFPAIGPTPCGKCRASRFWRMLRGGEGLLVGFNGFVEIATFVHEYSVTSSIGIGVDTGWCCSSFWCRFFFLICTLFLCVPQTYQLLTFCGWRCCLLLFARLIASRSKLVPFAVVVVAGAVHSRAVAVSGGLVVSVRWLLLLHSFLFVAVSRPLFARFADLLGCLGRVSFGLFGL